MKIFLKFLLEQYHFQLFEKLLRYGFSPHTLAGPTLDSEGMGAFFGANFSEKRAFCLVAPPKQMPFLTISNENIFFKTQGTRLGAIFAPNKRLE